MQEMAFPPQPSTNTKHHSNSISPQTHSKSQLSTTRWQQPLRERGILKAALAARWKPWQLRHQGKPWGWSYPIYDPVSNQVFKNTQARPILRWKNLDKDSQGGPKYAWVFGQQECPPWYILPGTAEAIVAATGRVYIAAGEVDVLSYKSAGFNNTLAWLNGEVSVPNNTAERLLALNVREVVYFVDRDVAGEESAQTLAARLRETPIVLTAYRLPEYLGPGGDINDLWQWSKFDAANFTQTLKALRREQDPIGLHQTANFPAQAERQPSQRSQGHENGFQRTGQGQSVDWTAERILWVQQELLPVLDQVAPIVKQEGAVERRQCPNPQHTDKNPSFRISYDRDQDTGIPVCTCGIQNEKKPWDRVAAWVGARSLKTWFKQERRQFYERKRIQPGKPSSLEAEIGEDQSAIVSLTTTSEEDRRFPSLDDSTPYEVVDNRMFFEKTNDKDGTIKAIPIADFYAQIVETIRTPTSQTIYRLKGETRFGKWFALEIEAEAFSDARQLKAALEKAAGPRCAVMVRMSEHLGPAIKRLTLNPPEIHKFDRTGWHQGQFLLPGHTSPEIKFSLSQKLPYHVDTEADLNEGLQVLYSLIQAISPEASLPALTFLFQAPLAERMGWRSNRYALSIVGRTGSFKTSWTQVAMTLYGQNFIHDEHLVKWGEGATRNAIMQLATQPSDLPFLIDNYKPNTGNGSSDFRNLIHNILEGGEKNRLDRNSELKESRPIFSWPIITAEDVPDDDPATLARLLVVEFAWQRGEPNPHLRQAREQSQHLNAVGAEWISWLESPEVHAILAQAKPMFVKKRDFYAELLRKRDAQMANIMRVATNLASNATTFWILERHPQLGRIFTDFQAVHEAGLMRIVQQMASGSSDNLPAQILLSTLHELLASGRCYLQDRDKQSAYQREGMIGYQDAEGVYLLFDLAKAEVLRVKGQGGLGGASSAILYTQLRELGLIASKNRDSSTLSIKVQGRPIRVLHLKRVALEPAEGEGA